MKISSWASLAGVAGAALTALTLNLAAEAGTPAAAPRPSEAHKEMSMSSTVKTMNLVETAVAAGSFKTLVAAVQAAGLVETLQGKGPYTVFAPTDEAFAKLPKGTLEDLLKPENKATLISILTYHVVPGKVMAADVVKLRKAKTLEGTEIDVVAKDGRVTVDGANVVKTDVIAENGVIHVIDAVILPKPKATK